MAATHQTIDLDAYCDSVAVVHEADGVCEEQIHEAIGGISNLYSGLGRTPPSGQIHTRMGFVSRHVPARMIVASIEACTGVPTELAQRLLQTLAKHLRDEFIRREIGGRDLLWFEPLGMFGIENLHRLKFRLFPTFSADAEEQSLATSMLLPRLADTDAGDLGRLINEAAHRVAVRAAQQEIFVNVSTLPGLASIAPSFAEIAHHVLAGLSAHALRFTTRRGRIEIASRLNARTTSIFLSHGPHTLGDNLGVVVSFLSEYERTPLNRYEIESSYGELARTVSLLRTVNSKLSLRSVSQQIVTVSFDIPTVPPRQPKEFDLDRDPTTGVRTDDLVPV